MPEESKSGEPKKKRRKIHTLSDDDSDSEHKSMKNIKAPAAAKPDSDDEFDII